MANYKYIVWVGGCDDHGMTTTLHTEKLNKITINGLSKDMMMFI